MVVRHGQKGDAVRQTPVEACGEEGVKVGSGFGVCNDERGCPEHANVGIPVGAAGMSIFVKWVWYE